MKGNKHDKCSCQQATGVEDSVFQSLHMDLKKDSCQWATALKFNDENLRIAWKTKLNLSQHRERVSASAELV